MNRIVGMILNQVMRHLVNLLVNRGFHFFARRGGSAPNDTGQTPDPAQLDPAARQLRRDTEKRARLAVRTQRRLGR